MNSDTINIGTSQSVVPPAFKSINIGHVASLRSGRVVITGTSIDVTALNTAVSIKN
jgi:hypothetical protein